MSNKSVQLYLACFVCMRKRKGKIQKASARLRWTPSKALMSSTLLKVPSPSTSARLNILMAPAATIWFSRLRALAAAVRPFQSKSKRLHGMMSLRINNARNGIIHHFKPNLLDA
jgi:hypothetical protein